jgi:hypothetical protein
VASEAADPLADRLLALYRGLEAVIGRHRPHEVAVEETVVNRNALSSLKLGHARGVVLLAAANAGLPVAEYAAKHVKRALTGTGGALKPQVAHMVRVLLPRAGSRRRTRPMRWRSRSAMRTTGRPCCGSPGPPGRRPDDRRAARPDRPDRRGSPRRRHRRRDGRGRLSRPGRGPDPATPAARGPVGGVSVVTQVRARTASRSMASRVLRKSSGSASSRAFRAWVRGSLWPSFPCWSRTRSPAPSPPRTRGR